MDSTNRPFELVRDDLWDAWLHVQENGGCAGADGVTVERFAEKAESALSRLMESVQQDTYRALPLLKIVVEKSPGTGRLRRLLIPAVIDRVLQTAVAHHLSRSFEEEFLEASFAYRPGRSVDRAIARVCQWRSLGFHHVVQADIEGFFDHVDHSRLLSMLAVQHLSVRMMGLLRQWIKASYWDGSHVRCLQVGIAQGSPLSPLFANFFLEPFDAGLEESGNHLVRYADDFLVLCRTPKAAEEALHLSSEFLAAEKLRLSLEKTRIASFDRGFHFLGAYFLKDDVYIPWKREHRHSRLFFVAKPMSAFLLARYLEPKPRPAVGVALERVGLVYPSVEVQPAALPWREPVSYLYITEQGAVLRKSGDRFLVEKDDRVELDLPYHKLESVLIFGSVQVTTQAMAELLDKGITVSLFSRQGRFRGSLDPPRGKNIHLRVAQFAAYKDTARSLQIARAAIYAKIANGIVVLTRYADRQAQPEGYSAVRETLVNSLEAVSKAPNVQALLGIEGTAAHAQFKAMMMFNRSRLEWEGRVRHPATDPLNALMSLTYSLIMHEISGLLAGVGLDPYLGYLHQLDYGRPSLSLDLLEPFRHPVADRMVLTLVNKKMFSTGDFQKAGDREGLFLSPSAMRRFFAEFEKWMITVPQRQLSQEDVDQELPSKVNNVSRCFRNALKTEVEKFAATLRDNRQWLPYRFGGAEQEESCDTSSVTI